jgi:uncharacterized membrane protein
MTETIIFIFAQQSGKNDLFFRILLVLLGLMLAFVGVLAVRQKRIHFRKYNFTLQGIPAMILGSIIAVLGLGATLAALASLFGLEGG